MDEEMCERNDHNPSNAGCMEPENNSSVDTVNSQRNCVQGNTTESTKTSSSSDESADSDGFFENKSDTNVEKLQGNSALSEPWRQCESSRRDRATSDCFASGEESEDSQNTDGSDAKSSYNSSDNIIKQSQSRSSSKPKNSKSFPKSKIPSIDKDGCISTFAQQSCSKDNVSPALGLTSSLNSSSLETFTDDIRKTLGSSSHNNHKTKESSLSNCNSSSDDNGYSSPVRESSFLANWDSLDLDVSLISVNPPRKKSISRISMSANRDPISKDESPVSVASTKPTRRSLNFNDCESIDDFETKSPGRIKPRKKKKTTFDASSSTCKTEYEMSDEEETDLNTFKRQWSEKESNGVRHDFQQASTSGSLNCDVLNEEESNTFIRERSEEASSSIRDDFQQGSTSGSLSCNVPEGANSSTFKRQWSEKALNDIRHDFQQPSTSRSLNCNVLNEEESNTFTREWSEKASRSIRDDFQQGSTSGSSNCYAPEGTDSSTFKRQWSEKALNGIMDDFPQASTSGSSNCNNIPETNRISRKRHGSDDEHFDSGKIDIEDKTFKKIKRNDPSER